MLHNWSGDEEERFPFWSGMEIVRVGVIAGLAIVPVSVSAIDAPASRPKPAPIQREIKAGFQTGRLLSTRQVEFDVRALDLTSLGDRDPDVVR